MQKVAFFDIDGTVFRSSLLIELVDALIKNGVFPEEADDEFLLLYKDWKNRVGSYKTYIEAVVDAHVKYIKGVHYGDYADVGRQVVAINSLRTYRYTRDLIKKLKQEDYYLVAISHSPKTILDIFCPQYGFDKVYGTIYEIGPQDRFTGEVTDRHLIGNKANIVKRVFDHNDQLTKEGAIAVGDTDSDIPLLESVDNPICFNPNQALYSHAKRMKWEIVVERKDVVYFF